MCGIAGYYCPQGRAGRSPESIRTEFLPQVLKHRGPDSSGTWMSENREVFLFHARLAIQDLSPLGHQPMESRSGRFVITFNGEIYNFKELSRELESVGIALRGHSDTEVLLEYIDRFGLSSALDRITGMFAFALVDRADEKLFLVRDRIGEKPLYVYLDQGVLAFASELKALKSMFGGLGEIDQIALAQYFRYGYVPDPRSIYAKARKLAPGSILTISLKRHSGETSQSLADLITSGTTRYWDLFEVRRKAIADPYTSRAEALADVHQTLRKKISDQSIADVDVGVFLSGGIDSTLVAAILRDVKSGPVKSFTIGFEDPSYNEARFAAEIAKHLGTEHHELTLTDQDLLAQIKKLPSVYDEPFANPSQIPMLLLSKHARSEVKVCLSGDGGDELFGGYNRYLWGSRVVDFKNKYPDLVSKIGSRLSGIAVNHGAAIDHLIRLVSSKPVQNVEGKLRKLHNALTLKSGSELYDYLLTTCFDESPQKSLPDLYRIDMDYFATERFADAAMLSDQLHYLPGDNLVKVDRASMHHSLETRLPLVDHDLIFHSHRMPVSMKWNDGLSKSILRDILTGYVPPRLYERPKMGFSVPIADWLKGALKDWGDNLVYSREILNADEVDPEFIERLWREYVDNKSHGGDRMWGLLIYLDWRLNEG